MIAETNGTPIFRQVSMPRAIASAWPRDSASMPGCAPGVSTSVITGSFEPVGQFHQANGLAIAFGLGHAEAVAHATRRIVALLMAEDRDRAALEAAEPAHDRLVVGKGTVARQRHEVGDEPGDVVAEMRPLEMARDQGLLPGRQLGIGLPGQLLDLGLQLRHFLGDVDLVALGEMLQLGNLAFELGDRFFKVEEGGHEVPL